MGRAEVTSGQDREALSLLARLTPEEYTVRQPWLAKITDPKIEVARFMLAPPPPFEGALPVWNDVPAEPFDLARLETKGTPDFQTSNRTLVGIGGGLRFNPTHRILGRNVSARLDWGYPIGERPASERRRARLHFSLSFDL